MNIQNKTHMEFTRLELELMRYAMYDLLNQDDNHAQTKCEEIIHKIDKNINTLRDKAQ